MPRLISCKATSCEAPVDSAYRAGITRAITATTNIVTWIPDASREKVCDLWRNPPASMLTPSTRRTFPMIEPVREALTTSVRPLDRAKIAMISSVALPKVALRRPPTPGPACLPSSSVARPRNQASGTIARPATAKTMTPGPRSRSRIQLSGTKRPNRRAHVYARSGSKSIAPRNVRSFLTPRAIAGPIRHPGIGDELRAPEGCANPGGSRQERGSDRGGRSVDRRAPRDWGGRLSARAVRRAHPRDERLRQADPQRGRPERVRNGPRRPTDRHGHAP